MLTTLISFYCAASYLFMSGVATKLPNGKKFKRWVLVLSPLYIPFLFGEHVMLAMRVNANVLNKQMAKQRQQEMERINKAAEAATLGKEFSEMAKAFESIFNVGRPGTITPRQPRTEWQKRMDKMNMEQAAEKAFRDFLSK